MRVLSIPSKWTVLLDEKFVDLRRFTFVVALVGKNGVRLLK